MMMLMTLMTTLTECSRSRLITGTLYTNMFNPHSGANLIMRKIRPGSVRNLIKVIKLVNHDLGCRTLSSDIIFFNVRNWETAIREEKGLVQNAL